VGRSILESGRQECGNRDSRHVAAKCGGLTASFAPDFVARRSAGRAAVPVCSLAAHGLAVGEFAAAARLGLTASVAERVVAAGDLGLTAAVAVHVVAGDDLGLTADVAERALVVVALGPCAGHSVRAWFARACPVAVRGDLALRFAAPAGHRQKP
jgi:hypothetical protein